MIKRKPQKSAKQGRKSSISPIELYYWPTPNGHKISIFLEEARFAYLLKPVNINTGEQFDPAFLARWR